MRLPKTIATFLLRSFCAASFAINELSFMVKGFTGTKLRNKSNVKQPANDSGLWLYKKRPPFGDRLVLFSFLSVKLLLLFQYWRLA